MALRQILGKASKRGPIGGIQPISEPQDVGGTKLDDVMLRQQYNGGIAGKPMETSNGSVAAPIKGRKEGRAAKLKGGKL